MRLNVKSLFFFCTKAFALMLTVLSIIFVTACGVDKNSSEYQARLKELSFVPESERTPTQPFVIKIAYEAKEGSALDNGVRQWKALAEDYSFGKLKFELYPNNSLGNRHEIEQRIENGENIATFTDVSLMYENGQKEVSVFASPYLINNWDEAMRLTSGDWYKRQVNTLLETRGIRTLSSRWRAGSRHILSTIPIVKAQELSYLKIAVPDDTINYNSLKYMGCMPITIGDPRDINAAFKNKKINSVEENINTIYDNKYYENAKYLFLSAHMYKTNSVIISNSIWNDLDVSQKYALQKSCERAADFYNIVQNVAEYETLKHLAAQGVTITEPNSQYVRVIKRITKDFVRESKMSHSWTPQLYSELGRLKEVYKPILTAKNHN